MANKTPRLTPDQLAVAVAQTYAYLGKVYGMYDGGGWITITGNNLLPHPDMKAQYPNGWSMMERIRTGEARKRLIEACR